jgi:hypothetical protein
MHAQPNNDTMHAESLAGGSLARKTEKGTKRTREQPTTVAGGCLVHHNIIHMDFSFGEKEES